MNNKAYIPLYDWIRQDKRINNLEEYTLLCCYIKKYKDYGLIIASDTKDSEILMINRKYVKSKREHLKELNYINYEIEKGKPIEIRLNPWVIEKIGKYVKDKSNGEINK